MRVDGRASDQIRPVKLTPNFISYPEGSVLFAMGETQVLCNATIEPGVPHWMRSQSVPGGWVTAEYALLPRSTQQRTSRETSGLRGRTQEIRRMIGRSLRMAVDLEKIGPRTCIIDCDVLQADGGTRTAAITGGYIALAMALEKLIRDEIIPENTFKTQLAAVSVGIVGGQPLLDLCYAEDFAADVDVNVVMTAAGEYIELQGTAEGKSYSRGELNQLLDLANKGIGELLTFQSEVLASRKLNS